MSLHLVTAGSGPDLVLLHGWGLNSGVFDGLAAVLAPAFRVTRVDLPGHGLSPAVTPATAGAWAAAVAAAVPRPALWLGWSLGGLLALQAALDHPAAISGLVLLTASPRCLSAAAWPGMTAATLAAFAAGLTGDYQGTLRRFLALQVQGCEDQGVLLRRLREQLLRRAPRPEALTAGLAILRDTDLRVRLASLAMPSLWLYGEHDRIVPVQTAAAVAALLPGTAVACLPGAGHAPFLTRAADLGALVRDWSHEQRR